MSRLRPAILATLWGAASVGLGCSAQFEGPPPRLDRIDEPVAMAATADACHVFVANGNFDLRERGGGVVVVDVVSRRVIPDSGVEIGAFPAQLRLHPGGGKLYATVRGDDSITWIDVLDADGDGAPDLSCGAGPGQRCGRDRKMRLRRSERSSLSVSEPLSLELTCRREAGRCVADDPGELGLMSTWLGSGVVAYFPLADDGSPLELDSDLGIRLVEDLQQQEAVTVSGVAGLAMAPDGRTGYVASFADDRLRKFRIEAAGAKSVVRLKESQSVIGGTFDNRTTEMRGIAVDTQGDRLFLASRHRVINRPNPVQIYVVDTPTDGDGVPDFRVTASVPVSGTPGLLRVLTIDPAANPPRDLVYAVIFGGDRIAVLDPLRMDVVDVIDLGDGPFDLTFVTPPEDSACATRADGLRRMEAWVTEFGENSIAIIDINPDSPTYHQVIDSDA